MKGRKRKMEVRSICTFTYSSKLLNLCSNPNIIRQEIYRNLKNKIPSKQKELNTYTSKSFNFITLCTKGKKCCTIINLDHVTYTAVNSEQ